MDERSLRDALFQSTVRIVVTSRREGSTIRLVDPPEVATGFLLQPPTRVVAKPQIFVVTAAHVVEDAEDASIYFFRRVPGPDGSRLFEFRRKAFFGELWHYSTDRELDIAVTPVAPSSEIASAVQDVQAQLTAFMLYDGRLDSHGHPFKTHDFEEVLFAGYPRGYWDPLSGSPIVRRGVTATPLSVDYHGAPAFLVDGAVYPGCSGGPVVVIEQEVIVPFGLPVEWIEYQTIRLEERFRFLGMITHVQHEQGNPHALLNLGRAIKADAIFSTIRHYTQLTDSRGSA